MWPWFNLEVSKDDKSISFTRHPGPSPGEPRVVFHNRIHPLLEPANNYQKSPLDMLKMFLVIWTLPNVPHAPVCLWKIVLLCEVCWVALDQKSFVNGQKWYLHSKMSYKWQIILPDGQIYIVIPMLGEHSLGSIGSKMFMLCSEAQCAQTINNNINIHKMHIFDTRIYVGISFSPIITPQYEFFKKPFHILLKLGSKLC